MHGRPQDFFPGWGKVVSFWGGQGHVVWERGTYPEIKGSGRSPGRTAFLAIFMHPNICKMVAKLRGPEFVPLKQNVLAICLH